MKSDVFLSSPKSYQKFGYLINKIYDQEHLKITHLVTVSYHIIISRMINVKNIYEEIRHKPWSSGLGIKPMLLYEETDNQNFQNSLAYRRHLEANLVRFWSTAKGSRH